MFLFIALMLTVVVLRFADGARVKKIFNLSKCSRWIMYPIFSEINVTFRQLHVFALRYMEFITERFLLSRLSSSAAKNFTWLKLPRKGPRMNGGCLTEFLGREPGNKRIRRGSAKVCWSGDAISGRSQQPCVKAGGRQPLHDASRDGLRE